MKAVLFFQKLAAAKKCAAPAPKGKVRYSLQCKNACPHSDTQQALLFYNQLLDGMLKRYGLPNDCSIPCLHSRKQAQLVCIVGELRPWEQLALQQYRCPPVTQQHRQILLDIQKASFLSAVENYYHNRIAHYYIFAPHYHSNLYYTYSIKLFEKPLFKNVDPHHAPVEEALSNRASHLIRQLNGKGPETVSAALLGDGHLLFVIKGLFSEFSLLLASNNSDKIPIIKEPLSLLVSHVVGQVCREQYDFAPAILIEADLTHNQIVALALLNDRV